MLQWTVPNFALWISTDVSTNGWWATCQGMSIGGLWSQEEQKAHINILELKVIHLAILTFTLYNFSMDTCPDEQQSNVELPGKDGGHLQQGPYEPLQIDICSPKRSQLLQTTKQFI